MQALEFALRLCFLCGSALKGFLEAWSSLTRSAESAETQRALKST